MALNSTTRAARSLLRAVRSIMAAGETRLPVCSSTGASGNASFSSVGALCSTSGKQHLSSWWAQPSSPAAAFNQHHQLLQLQAQQRGIAASAPAASQCDCPTLGGPQPDVVVVEYDEDEVDRFIALADAIEAALPHLVVEGNPNGPGRPGAFEVSAPGAGSSSSIVDDSGSSGGGSVAGGALVFSRLGSGGWPAADDVVARISAAEAAAQACALPGGQ